LVTLAATVIAALCGTLAGWTLGGFATLKLTKRTLLQQASRALAEEDLRITESSAVLGAMKASTEQPCSTAELTYFRALIFDAKYLKDAGRMSGGKIDCSASLARPAQPLGHADEDLTLTNGIRFYKNLAPYQSEDMAMISLRQGDFFIVVIPSIQPHSSLGPEHYVETERDTRDGQLHWLLGDPPPASAAAFTGNGFVRLGERLYATQCSHGYSNCVTAYISIPEVMRADRIQFRMFVALGALIGGLFGFVVSILYRRNRSIEQQLRRAIRNDQLQLAYQPIVSLPAGKIVGAEALARWTDEDGFAVGPDTFIKVAEENGFVDSITAWVVRRALHDFAAMLRSNPDFYLSINIAASDLADPGFLEMLENELTQAGVKAESLSIEITESSTARHGVAIETIRKLHERGHSVHIDDFGTGYSSLSYLQDLAIDTIKIDKSFTRSIGTEAITTALLPQILGMAAALKLRVIVEGVETGEQALYFSKAGDAILAQGWHFGRAVPVSDFKKLLEAEK
jgi:sensor c-di-GMP phosphodiesterase-like protein